MFMDESEKELLRTILFNNQCVCLCVCVCVSVCACVRVMVNKTGAPLQRPLPSSCFHFLVDHHIGRIGDCRTVSTTSLQRLYNVSTRNRRQVQLQHPLRFCTALMQFDFVYLVCNGPTASPIVPLIPMCRPHHDVHSVICIV